MSYDQASQTYTGDTMMAAEQVDRLIAEKVMGWTLRDNLIYEDEVLLMHLSRWNPSCEIGDAWKVLSSLLLRGIDVRIATRGYSWCASISSSQQEFISESAPYAICRAALAAIAGIQ